MQHCWNTTPEKRPTFEYLSDFFNDYESTEPNYRSEKLELQLMKKGLLSANMIGARNRTPPTAIVSAATTAVPAVDGAMHSSFVPIEASSTQMFVHPESLLPHPASFVQMQPVSVSASQAHSLSSPAQQPRAPVPVEPHAAAAGVPASQLVHASNGSLAGAQPLPIGADFRVVPNASGPPLPLVYATPGDVQVPLEIVSDEVAVAAAAASPSLQQLVQQPSTSGSTSLPNAVHLQLQQLQLATASDTSMLQQQMAAAHATKSPLALQSATQLPPDHNAIDSGGRSVPDPLTGAINMED